MARRKKREGQSLHKVLGVPALFSTAYGNVGSSIYYALGVVALSALGLTPVVFMLTGLLFVTTALSYAEATTMFPEAGGSSSFARHTFNEFVSFGAGWALMLDYIITIAISAFFVPNYLATFWPILKLWPYNSIGGIAVVAFLVTINVIGIKEAARLNIILAILDLSTQLLLAIVGAIVLLKPTLLVTQIHLGTAPTWTQLIYGISIGTVAYTGIETVSNMAEESANPGKDVPRSIKLVLAAVLFVYFAISMVGLSAMPVKTNIVPADPATHLTVAQAVKPLPGKTAEAGPWAFADTGQPVYVPVNGKRLLTIPQKATGPVYQQNGRWVTKMYGTWVATVYEADPLQGIVQSMPKSLSWLRVILAPWIGILAATILIIGTNAGIIGVSRLAYSMAQHKQLPPIVGRVHPRRMTPYVSIILFGVIASLIIAPGRISLLADLYAFGAMISFTVAHVCVVTLRVKQPDTVRPYRLPLNVRIRGYQIPTTAVIGGLGTFTVWWVVVITHVAGRYVGLSWMAIGIVTYILYRRANGMSLTRTVKGPELPAYVQADIIYDQLLVPIVGSQVTDEMMVLASQLAAERNSAIDALYVIEVPMNLPLDAALARERDAAQQVLDRAAVIADQFGVKMTPVIVTARQAGRAICDEAAARRSEVIILGAARKRRIAERVFGRTIDYVLQHAPCEVLVNLVPKGYGETLLGGDGGAPVEQLVGAATPAPSGDGRGTAEGEGAGPAMAETRGVEPEGDRAGGSGTAPEVPDAPAAPEPPATSG